MKNKLTIVIPTLDRPQNIPRMLAMFPDAIVTVNRSNVDMFRAVVPTSQLLPHPDLRLIETRNWILDNIQSECIVSFNDDITSLIALGLRTKTHRDPGVIRAVIENTMQCAADLDVGVFCWSLTKNNGLLHPEVRPFRAAAPCSAHAFGVCGKVRDRRFDTTFRGCGDFDFTLDTLLRDRLLLCDVRWHFACGGMSRGKGGQAGELAPQEALDGQDRLRKKWGKYIGESKTKRVERRQTWRTFSVNVQRTSPLGIS